MKLMVRCTQGFCIGSDVDDDMIFMVFHGFLMSFFAGAGSFQDGESFAPEGMADGVQILEP